MICRCVLEHAINGAKAPCRDEAVPDSPFCLSCQDRHPEEHLGWNVLVDTSPVEVKT